MLLTTFPHLNDQIILLDFNRDDFDWIHVFVGILTGHVQPDKNGENQHKNLDLVIGNNFFEPANFHLRKKSIFETFDDAINTLGTVIKRHPRLLTNPVLPEKVPTMGGYYIK
jgi:hypothetical protein